MSAAGPTSITGDRRVAPSDLLWSITAAGFNRHISMRINSMEPRDLLQGL